LNDSQMSAAQVFDRFSGVSASGLEPDEDAKRFEKGKGAENALWVIETNHLGTWNGDTSTDVMGFDTTSFGAIMGNDILLAKEVKAGWTLSFNRLDLASTDSATARTGINSFLGGGYGNFVLGAVEISGLIEAGLDQYETTRTVTMGSDVSQLNSSFNGSRVIGALRFSVPVINERGLALKPYAAMQYSLLSQDGFTETGSDSLDLSVAAQTYNSFRPIVGLGGAGKFVLDPKLELIPALDLSASREVGTVDPAIHAGFAGLTGVPFTSSGDTAADPTLIGLGLGLKVAFLDQFNIFSKYTGYFGSGQTSTIVNAGADFNF
jgi:outer membrane autotransporter protein